MKTPDTKSRPPPFLTLPAIADRLGVHRSTAWQMHRERRLPAPVGFVGRVPLFSEKTIQRLARKRDAE